jgi:subtilase family serine protease
MRLPAPATNSRSVFRLCHPVVLQASLLMLLAVVFPAFSRAQNAPPKPALITQPLEESNLTVLRGNTYPLARAQYDRGAAPASLPMQRMLLVLKRSPALEASLEALLDQQQDKSSPNYHAWLTPEQFGQQFGPADSDIQAITSWLQLQGFQVARVSKSRTVIEFSGTAAQVQNAFHTEIHKYTVNGKDHWANSSDPQIPSALLPAVAGIDTLHNFPRHAMHYLGRTYTRSKETGAAKPVGPPAGPVPLFTLSAPNGCGVQRSDCYALGPYDFATIYDVLPLWNATPTHIDGTGQTIAVVAESNIDPNDVTSFRSFFGLTNPPKLNVILNGPDPGLDSGGAETEADLDVEWSGAIAPNATIDLVVSQSTETTLGADLSAVYAVDNNLAPVLNVSFGICEFGLGTAGNQFFNQLWQQAAAQGITVLVATGDSGSAVCDRGDGPPPAPAVFGLTVSGFSTTPYNVAVGGTDFNDLTNAPIYWSLTNSAPASNPSAHPTLSAKSYIPETTWNDTCTNGVFGTLLGFSTNAETNCNDPQLVGFVAAVGGSGGQSNCITSDGQNESTCSGAYPIPSWQTGTGVPTKGGRAVPDVSLFASVNSPSGSFYIICEADFLQGASSCDPTNPATEFLGIGGTSASAPTFSAIMALVNQQTKSAQGNANYVLYKLAMQQPTAFHDVPVGGTIAMPCANGSPNCTVTNKSDAYGVLSGFSTTAGYDLATGLGSVDANILVTKWSSVATKGSATTLTLSPTPVNVTHGQPVNVSIDVTAAAPAMGTPTGNVSLIANTVPPGSPAGVTDQGVQGFQLTSGSVSSTTNILPGGSYTVVAQYPGDGIFGPSTSSPVSVVVAKEASAANIVLQLYDPVTGLQTNPNATMTQYGSSFELLRVNMTSQSGDTCVLTAVVQTGCPTGSVTITNNGTPLDAGMFQLNSQGYAEDQTVQLPGGTDNLKVTYAGDNSFTATTAMATIMVTKAPTTSGMSPVSGIFLGEPADLNVGITSTGVGAGPTGQVTFFSNMTQLGSPVPISITHSGISNNQPSAVASLITSQLTLGSNSITAQYSGDGNYAASTSPPITVNAGISTTLSISSSNTTIAHGSSVTFTAKVTPNQTANPVPTGTVVFSDGFGAFGTSPLTNSQAQITTSALPGGILTITAQYNGDADYFSSINSLTETVNLLATNTTVSTSNSAIQQGASATLTAHVAPFQQGGPALTGTVQFFSALSATSSENPVGSAVTLSSGQAQVTTTSLPANTQLVFATYSGDSNYASSNGSTAEVVTPAPDFSIAANPSSITITRPGQPGSTMLMLTAMNGLAGTFTLVPQCTGLPSESSCSVSPASVTFSSTVTTATVMLTVSTTAPSSAPASRRFQPTNNRPGAIFAIGLFALLSLLGLRRRRRGIQIAFSVMAFAAVLTFAACGGGGGGGGVKDPGTPVGLDSSASVSFTIGTATHTLPLSINVQ